MSESKAGGVPGSYRGNYDLYSRQTPAQTVGPFFCQGLVRVRSIFQAERLCSDERDVFHNLLASDATPGERLRLEGTVYDGLDRPIPDALLEIWQADAQGRYQHSLQPGGVQPGGVQPGGVQPGGVQPREQQGVVAFQGFGRAATDDTGRFFFETIRPGAVPGLRGSAQAAHINLVLGARGMARLAFTRIYFAGDPALALDPVLARVPPARRATLLARAAPGGPGQRTHVFDIHLQGEHETVFFDF